MEAVVPIDALDIDNVVMDLEEEYVEEMDEEQDEEQDEEVHHHDAAQLVGSHILTHHVISGDGDEDDEDDHSVVSTLSRSTLVVQAIPMAQVMGSNNDQQQLFVLCEEQAGCAAVHPFTTAAPPSSTTRTISWNSSSSSSGTHPATADAPNPPIEKEDRLPLRSRYQQCCMWIASVLAVLAIVVLVLNQLELKIITSAAAAAAAATTTTAEPHANIADPWSAAPNAVSLTPSLSPSEFPTLSPATPLQSSETVVLEYTTTTTTMMMVTPAATAAAEPVVLSDAAISQWHTLLASGLAAAWVPRQFGTGIVLDHVAVGTTTTMHRSSDSNTMALAVTIYYYDGATTPHNNEAKKDDPWPPWVYTTAQHQQDALLRQLQLLNPEFQALDALVLIVPDEHVLLDDDDDDGDDATLRSAACSFRGPTSSWVWLAVSIFAVFVG